MQIYIDMNFEGLRDDILSMIAGETVPVNTRSFTNDMTTFRTEDDVLTLLIHLGYLGYRYADKTVFIPNEEIRSEYVSAIAVSDWGEVSKALKIQQIHCKPYGREEKSRSQRALGRRTLKHLISNIMTKMRLAIPFRLHFMQHVIFTQYTGNSQGEKALQILFMFQESAS